MTGIIRLNLMDDTVKQEIAMLPKKMGDVAFEELLQQAELMKGYAQILVRVNTGSLRDSIRLEISSDRIVKVKAGGAILNPQTGKIVNYASFVEAKYPFMRPAWDQIKGNVALLIERKVVESVNK